MDKRPQAPPDDKKQEPDGRYSNATIEQLRRDNDVLKAELADIKKMLADMHKALLGNGGGGILESVRDFPALMETMGRVMEKQHLQIQRQNEIIAGLVSKLQLEELISGAVQSWQFKAMRDALVEQAG